MVSSSFSRQPLPTRLAARSAAPPDTWFGRVVVGADNSHWGRLALRWAAEHAWLVGAELEVHSPPAANSKRLCSAADLDDVQCSFPGLPVYVWPCTRAIDALVTASRDAALVVLGCQGTGRRGTDLGATVVPVAEFASCDVVVVGGRPDAVHSTNRRVCVLLGNGDGTDLRMHALRSASRFALHRRMELSIRRLVPPVGRGTATTVRVERAALDHAADVVLDLVPNLRVRTQLLWASPHEAVAGIADTDLLVVGADGPLDALARAALRHARSPVLIAHPEPGR